MKVCIAEKPSVAQEIAKIVGATTRRDGFYEGNGYQITWTFGHLCTLKEPHEYSEGLKRWSLFSLPIIPARFSIKLISDKGVEKQFGIIEKLVQGAEEVINCGDAGQEGELIQRWVLTKAQCKAPIKRLWISSLTEEAIKDGFKSLKPAQDFDLLYAAGSARAIGDWLLGINATRLFTLKYSNNQGVLSIGRVQTPTLALIVKRQDEIDNFVPQPYWELKTLYRETTFSVKSGRFLKKEEAEEAMLTIKDHPITITGINTKKGKEAPPKLFDLTSLQVECNKKLNLSAEDTLKTIQSLYEKKLTTYPRVDTTFLSNDIYPKVPGILKNMTPYSNEVAPILEKKIPKSKKVFNDNKVTDHHAIIPTGQMPQNLTATEKRMYDMVARRFIGAFYPDCEISNTTVEAEINKIGFKATGKQILKPGWRVLYKKDTSKTDVILPEFTKGESGEHKPGLAEKQTQPPKFYTEATLLRAMETAGKYVNDDELSDIMKENGIGRPSTRANIIETLFRRKYIRRERKNIVATITGKQLIGTIHYELLKSAELTGQWEKKLRQIEAGEFEVSVFMKEMKEMVSHVVHEVRQATHATIRIESEEEVKAAAKAKKEAEKAKAAANIECPKCKKGTLLKGNSAMGCSAWKDGCKFTIPFEFSGKKLTEMQIKAIATKGKSGEMKGFIVNDEKITGKVVLTDSFELKLEIKEEEKLVCPLCGKGEILTGNSAYGCSAWKEGCQLKVPFETGGKKLSQSQLKQLITKRKTSKIKGFTNVQGEKFDAKLILNDDGNVGYEI